MPIFLEIQHQQLISKKFIINDLLIIINLISHIAHCLIQHLIIGNYQYEKIRDPKYIKATITGHASFVEACDVM